MKLTVIPPINKIIINKDKSLTAVTDLLPAEVDKTTITVPCKTVTETVLKGTVMVEWEVYQLQEF